MSDAATASATSSDESFTPLTVVPVAPTSVDAAEIPVEGDEEGLEARTLLVRDQFEAGMVQESEAYSTAEDNQAFLLSMGYRNAQDWLANKKLLFVRLVKIGLKPATDDVGLLSQIAKLQIGRWSHDKQGNQVWKVPSRRDERLGKFYRIFFNDPVQFPVETLRDVILNYPKRSGGILNSLKPKKVTISKQEKADNRTAAQAVKKASVKLPDVNLGKLGTYKLVLARVTGEGFDLCTVIEGEDALTERLADKWAADAAMTVSSEAQ